MSKWFTEVLHDDQRQQLRIETAHYRGRTAFQSVEIFENPTHGRVLCLDGVVQTTEADEFCYHEMLVHPGMFAHGAPREVLIIGGADGGALREVLRHPVTHVTLVDIDAELIGLCRRYLPAISAGAFDDPRAHVDPGDGAQCVAGTSGRFDLVIVDSTDPVGPGAGLAQKPFFASCRRVLNEGGLVVTQNGVPFYQPQELAESGAHRRKVFRLKGFYASPVPLYAGGLMAFGWGSDRLDPGALPADALDARIAAAGLPLRYYNGGVHRGAFALPESLRRFQSTA